MSIEELIRKGARSRGTISIGGGLPSPELFPRKQLAQAFVSAMRDPACRALQYDWPEGQNDLREWVAARLRDRGADVQSADVVITAGAQQGLSLSAHFLIRKGARVKVERETYPAALELFKRRGAIVSSRDEDADCVYLVDGLEMPRGQRPSPRVRARLLQGDVPVIADEAYAELVFDGTLLRPLIADGRAHVWHVGTLSKTLSPGLRLGWLVPPRPMLKRVIELKQSIDLQSASLSQVITENFLATDDFDARLAKVRAFYARRAQLLARAVRRWLPDWRFTMPVGGFSIFLENDQQDAHEGDETWLRAALSCGVAFDPGSLFRADAGAQTLAMRLCYSATRPKELIEAVRRLASAWQKYRLQRARRSVARVRAEQAS